MAAVGAGDAVALAERAREADRDRLLARAEVRRPVHLAAQEQRLDELLEAPDQQHPAVEIRARRRGPRSLRRRCVPGRHARPPSIRLGADERRLRRSPASSGRRPGRRAGRRHGRTSSGDEQLLGREAREHLRAGRRDHDLLLDPRSRAAVGRRAVGLEREHHPHLELDRGVERVQPRDHRELVEADPDPVAELEAEGRVLVRHADLLRLGHTSAILSVVTPGRTRSIAASSHSRHGLYASSCDGVA